MWQAAASRRRMAITLTSNRKKELRNAGTLLCIAISFIICQSPKIIPDLHEAFTCDWTSEVGLRTLIYNTDFKRSSIKI